MYNREKAVNYATYWALRRNPDYYDFEYLGGDCTNFASQSIYAGCGQMNYSNTLGWYYNSLNDRAPAWTGVNELYNFLINNNSVGPKGRVVPLDEIEIGDIIQLDFNGDGRFDHTPFVVDRGNGTPQTILVSAHTNDSNYRPLSTYNYENLRAIKISC